MLDRRGLILKEVVDRYIKTRKPVSSKELVEEYGHRWCSATVRNELAALEREGYLYKPSPSAGRVPTAKGFRYFARWLLELGESREEEGKYLVEPFQRRLHDVEELLRLGALALATMAREAGFVIAPSLKRLRLLKTHLEPIGRKGILLIVLTELGLVGSLLVRLPRHPCSEDVAEAGAILDRLLRRRSLSQVPELLEAETGWYGRPRRIVREVLEAIARWPGERKLFLRGLQYLYASFSSPPGRGLPRELLRLLGEEQSFVELVLEIHRTGTGAQVRVGDLPVPGLEEVSLVSAPYLSGMGVLGVIGPLWLDYALALSAVRYVAKRLSGHLALWEEACESQEVSAR